VKIKEVTLEPLRSKHYTTDLTVRLMNSDLEVFRYNISISGYSSTPSVRETDRGWEPDDGMNHVEGQEHHILALIIKEALEKWK
jgi:hypothetical protein